MNAILHPVPPTECESVAVHWQHPVQSDLFGETLLQKLGIEEVSVPIVTTPTHAGNFLEGIRAVRVAAVAAPGWVTLFLCRKYFGQGEWRFYSGLAGGLAFGPALGDRLFYFHGCPNLEAPSATLDAAVRYALSEARDMFAGHRGAQDAATQAAANVIAHLLRLA